MNLVKRIKNAVIKFTYQNKMAKIKDYIHLMRVRQWYKNLVVFLAIFFSGNLLEIEPFVTTIFAFFSLALISSSNYIINDLKDKEKDKLNPEKMNRPLASGNISKTKAIRLMVVLLTLGIIVSLSVSREFFYLAAALFCGSQIYTFFLKEIPFADILTISSLFVIRSISGAVAIEVYVSPWLILCPFFLSLFLSVGKRQAEVLLLKKVAIKTRKVLHDYNNGLTNSLMIVSTTLLIISYALYSFLSENPGLIYTLPIGLFLIFKYFHLVSEGSIISRHPEKIVKNKQMMVGIIIWTIVTTMIIYY